MSIYIYVYIYIYVHTMMSIWFAVVLGEFEKSPRWFQLRSTPRCRGLAIEMKGHMRGLYRGIMFIYPCDVKWYIHIHIYIYTHITIYRGLLNLNHVSNDYMTIFLFYFRCEVCERIHRAKGIAQRTFYQGSHEHDTWRW